MQVIDDHGTLPGDVRSAVSIGVFDGVHVGHKALFDRLRNHADAEGLATAVVTFDRHPTVVTRPDLAPKLLTTLSGDRGMPLE